MDTYNNANILQILAIKIRKELEESKVDLDKVQEIRLREGRPICVKMGRENQFLSYVVKQHEIKETLDYISHYSLYAYENEMRQGFLTIEGGHRVGIAGKVIIDGGKIRNFQYISGLNIRVSREVKGCADFLFPKILDDNEAVNTMIISPPGSGKTTLLRDLVRQFSDGNQYLKGVPVSIVDERSEIAGCYRGVPQNDVGKQTDVLDACPKTEGMTMAIRALAPKILAVDEIGTFEDVKCISYAVLSGVSVLVTVHGHSLEEIHEKPALKDLLGQNVFQRYILLGDKVGEIKAIYNGRGECI